jgi:hypothetical protein
MIQRGGGASLLLEPAKSVGVGTELGREDFDGDLSTESRITRPIDLAHPAGPDPRKDFIRT